MDREKLVRSFVEILGAEAVIVGEEACVPYATDYTEEQPRMPAAVVLPVTVDQVQAVVRLARQHRVSLTPRVAGTNIGGLAIPPVGGVVLDLHRMNRVWQVDRDDMYAIIEPGVTWEQLKAHLEQEQVPLRLGYPMSPPDTSIVANCLLDGLGTLSLRYGVMGDWIGGLEAVLPDGQLIRTGAAALSDSWFGRAPLPDLTGCFVSWQGTSGIVTKMALQLWPTPACSRRMFLLLYDRNDAFQVMRDLSRMQICDDVAGLSWTTGKMLFGVPRPAERDPAEPEFFLYLELTGHTPEELAVREKILEQHISDLSEKGVRLEKPLDVDTLLRINPEFAKFAEFPTRLEFLADPPGGGLSWVGTYGPLSRFEAFGDAGMEIMNRHGVPPTVVSRPMKGGHFGVMRFITTFDKQDAAECQAVREVNLELMEAGVKLGFIPYKTPPWIVARLKDRLDPGFVQTLGRIRAALDPDGIMAPHCWDLK